MSGRHLAVPLAIVAAVSCATSPPPTASYDLTSRRLIRLDSDLNRDGTIDHRAYMDGNTPLRTESDQNGDGRVDRWEYYDASARLLRVGTSTSGDGIEDTWTHAVDADGERRVDISLVRDRAIDRREFYRDDGLVRAEGDSNGDGRIDRWERYEAGELLQVSLDTTLSVERPNRRLTYNRNGQFQVIEIDPDGDGQWEPSK